MYSLAQVLFNVYFWNWKIVSFSTVFSLFLACCLSFSFLFYPLESLFSFGLSSNLACLCCSICVLVIVWVVKLK